MNKSFAVLLMMIAPVAAAKVITTPGEKPLVALDGSDIAKRVCYYQDQAYSLGAIVQVGDHYMVCKETNSFETNGALKWATLEEKKKPQ